MKRNKVIVILLVILMAFSLVSCGKTNEPDVTVVLEETDGVSRAKESETETKMEMENPVFPLIVREVRAKYGDSPKHVILGIQIENVGEKVVSGYKCKIKFFGEDGEQVKERWMNEPMEGDFTTAVKKGLSLKKGYKTDRDPSLNVKIMGAAYSCEIAVFECIFEDGDVLEVPDEELEWTTFEFDPQTIPKENS